MSAVVLNNNQLSGYGYDAAGNMTSKSGATYTYDSENRLATAGSVTYTYDGDGKRVEKSNGKLYWYGMSSDVLDETNLSGTLTSEYVAFSGNRLGRRDSPSNNIFYYFEDHLGTSRVILQAGQTNPCYDADFYPFGGERIYTNTCPQNFKFTGKERDTESGLDNFDARYYSSNLGRFASSDWSAVPEAIPYAVFENPQSLNLYTYAQNNPLIRTDIDGHDNICLVCVYEKVKNYLSTPEGKQTVKGGAKLALGVALIATTAVGDAPGGAFGAVLVASSGIGAAMTTVSGTSDVLGAVSHTDVSAGQKVMDATSNLPGLVVTDAALAAGSSSDKAVSIGQTAATVSDAASLIAAPREAVRNPATAADAVRTVGAAADLVRGTIKPTPQTPQQQSPRPQTPSPACHATDNNPCPR